MRDVYLGVLLVENPKCYQLPLFCLILDNGLGSFLLLIKELELAREIDAGKDKSAIGACWTGYPDYGGGKWIIKN
jgi:hypothetical protein